MPAQQQDKPQAERVKPEPQLDAVISKQILNTLGQPTNLHRVQVRKLWDEHYRVNVFTGVDAASALVAHSYFLVTDAEGNIIAATPTILKQY